MATITAIRPQKRGKRVNIFLDGHFAFGLGKEMAQGLEVGKVLSPKEVQALTRKDTLQHALDFSLRFLSYRPRSEKEVRERLGRHKFPPEILEEAIAHLKGQGLLDDLAFARFWKEGRETAMPRGKRLIERELLQKGVDPGLAWEAVRGLDEEEMALRAARKKSRSLKGLDEEAFRKKMLSYLARRGFGWELCRRTLLRLKEAPDS